MSWDAPWTPAPASAGFYQTHLRPTALGHFPEMECHKSVSFFHLPPIIERMLIVSDKMSDLNFSVGQPPQVEINGKLTPVQPLGLQRLTPCQTEIIAMSLTL